MQTIEQKIHFDAPRNRVYTALTNAEQHTAFTGGPAQIDPAPGGEWSAHGGGIYGRTIELVPDERIVQAWRPASWPAGVYSLVRIELRDAEGGTELHLTHSALPDEGASHIDEGWHARYWQPLTKYLGST